MEPISYQNLTNKMLYNVLGFTKKHLQIQKHNEPTDAIYFANTKIHLLNIPNVS